MIQCLGKNGVFTPSSASSDFRPFPNHVPWALSGEWLNLSALRSLNDTVTVAYRLGLIPKPTMAQLMSLFIAWGSGYPQTTMV